MKHFVLATILILFNSAAFANKNLLVGSWHSVNPIQGVDVTYDVSFHITKTHVIMSAACNFEDGVRIPVAARSRYAYLFDQVHVMTLLDYDSEAIGNQEHQCSASLSPRKWMISFDGAGNMILQGQTPYASQFYLKKR